MDDEKVAIALARQTAQFIDGNETAAALSIVDAARRHADP
jgi:hypothetical protein